MISQLSAAVTITGTTISALASDNSYNDSGSGFVAAGFAVDDYVNVVGFTGNVANNIFSGKITALTTAKMTIGGTDGNVIVDDAAGESVTISKWVSQRATAQDIADLAGGGAAWALAGTGQTATGVYDFAVDGAKANIDFVGLGSYNELLVICNALTTTVTGVRQAVVSVNGGSTFYNASGDYITISAAAAEANGTGFNHSQANATAGRPLVFHILNTKGPRKVAFCPISTGSITEFIASASDIDALRILNVGGGNINGGTVRVYAR